MIGSSESTPYDLRFRFLDVPVRVGPWFWLAMLLISGRSDDLQAVAVFVACAFVSILLHEFGHGLAGRAMGSEPTEIVLYGFGGYCGFTSWPRSAWRRIIILICGPGAGFALLGLVFAGFMLAVRYQLTLTGSEIVLMAVNDLIFINLFWGILNLFPIWPLDGGRIMEVVLETANRTNGKRWTHVVSLLVAGCLGAWRLSVGDFFPGLWCGLFAVMNYQVLQAMHNSYQFEDRSW